MKDLFEVTERQLKYGNGSEGKVNDGVAAGGGERVIYRKGGKGK